MFLVEILKSLHRLRTWLLAAALAAVAILPVVVLAASGGDSGGGGPAFLDQVTSNGLFAALVGVGLIQPFFLPLGTGLLAGESIATEASGGTLRYLLVRPVGRTRLILTKYGSVMFQLACAVFWVMIVGLIAGGIAFGYGSLPTLSGQTIGAGAGVLRIVGAGLYVIAGAAGLAAIGVFISTLTDSGPGATVATTILAIGSQIVDNLSATHAVHPFLLTHGWLAYADLFRSPIEWSAIRQGLVIDAIYATTFLVAAGWWFSRKDVTS